MNYGSCLGGLQISENLKVIDNALELSYSQQQFSKKFEDFFDLRKKIEFSFPGGVTEGTIFFSEGSDFWYGHHVTKSPRYWNAFGIKNPFKTKKLPITCEINFPMDKINRRIAGVFAIDKKGEIHVLHRGKIGGNYSKSVFEKFYEGEWLEVVEVTKIQN